MADEEEIIKYLDKQGRHLIKGLCMQAGRKGGRGGRKREEGGRERRGKRRERDADRGVLGTVKDR